MTRHAQILDGAPMIEPAMFTIQECSAYLKIPVPTLYVKARNGLLPSLKVGRRILFPKADLDAWISKQVKKRMARNGA